MTAEGRAIQAEGTLRARTRLAHSRANKGLSTARVQCKEMVVNEMEKEDGNQNMLGLQNHEWLGFYFNENGNTFVGL